MFSELIDEIMLRAKRPEKQLDAIAYLNSSIRECQTLRFFHKDLIEDSFVATASPHIWTFPTNLRRLLTVRYGDGLGPDGNGSYPDFRKPGRASTNALGACFYYAASDYYAFKGVGIGTNIDVAYYAYLPKLRYYASGARPAVYNAETGTWTYLTEYDVNATTRATARMLVSNWLLFNWDMLLTEGTLAKLFKSIEDTARAATSYSLYQQMQLKLTSSENAETLGQ